MIGWLWSLGLALAADNPVELGLVRWQHGYDAAAAQAAQLGRPLLVLFDEVPGCSTVRAFGEGPLSHPRHRDAHPRDVVLLGGRVRARRGARRRRGADRVRGGT
jgi:hypothetical protein